MPRRRAIRCPAGFVIDLQVPRTAVSVAVLWQDAAGIHPGTTPRPGDSHRAGVLQQIQAGQWIAADSPGPAFGVEVQEIGFGCTASAATTRAAGGE